MQSGRVNFRIAPQSRRRRWGAAAPVRGVLFAAALWSACELGAGRLAPQLWGAQGAVAQEQDSAFVDRLTLLDGQTAEGQVQKIDDSGELLGPGLPTGLEVSQLRRLVRAARAEAGPAQKPAAVVELIGGGRLLAGAVQVQEERCHVQWSSDQNVSLPIDAVRAIRFAPEQPSAAFERALSEPSDLDRLFVRVPVEGEAPAGGEPPLQSVSGLVISLSADRIVFDREGEELAVAMDKLYGIVAAQVLDEARQFKVLARLSDGSSLPGESVTLDGERLTLRLAGETEAELPWSRIVQLEFRSNRLVFLSDLTPSEAIQQPLVTLPGDWRRDLSFSGGPLRLAADGAAVAGGKAASSDGSRGESVVYEKGLGVHSYSKLTFDVDGFDRFAAVIGIDAETEGRGDCLFRVLGDGQTLLEQRVRGDEPGRPINVDIRGVRQVSLVVEPGEDLDLADHADWADARFLKLDP